jgi:hypothetical protein
MASKLARSDGAEIIFLLRPRHRPFQVLRDQPVGGEFLNSADFRLFCQIQFFHYKDMNEIR